MADVGAGLIVSEGALQASRLLRPRLDVGPVPAGPAADGPAGFGEQSAVLPHLDGVSFDAESGGDVVAADGVAGGHDDSMTRNVRVDKCNDRSDTKAMTTAAESALISILTAYKNGDENDIARACEKAEALYEAGGPLNFESRIEVESQLWCQLLLGEIRAKSAWADVQESAEVYLRVGLLDLDKVLDALKIDEDEWHARVERNRLRKPTPTTSTPWSARSWATA